MKNEDNNMETTAWAACEPVVDSVAVECDPIIGNYDGITGVGPQSLEELREDLDNVERELKDPNQWDTLKNFMTHFKQTHSAWFK